MGGYDKLRHGIQGVEVPEHPTEASPRPTRPPPALPEAHADLHWPPSEGLPLAAPPMLPEPLSRCPALLCPQVLCSA